LKGQGKKLEENPATSLERNLPVAVPPAGTNKALSYKREFVTARDLSVKTIPMLLACRVMSL
jgi:hypothetical protein